MSVLTRGDAWSMRLGAVRLETDARNVKGRALLLLPEALMQVLHRKG